MKNEFGKMLQQSRRKRGMSIRKLAEMVGCSPSYLCWVELGKRLPPADIAQIQCLAIALNIDSTQLVQLAHETRMLKVNIMKAAPELYEACKEFVRKCENGEAGTRRKLTQAWRA